MKDFIFKLHINQHVQSVPQVLYRIQYSLIEIVGKQLQYHQGSGKYTRNVFFFLTQRLIFSYWIPCVTWILKCTCDSQKFENTVCPHSISETPGHCWNKAKLRMKILQPGIDKDVEKKENDIMNDYQCISKTRTVWSEIFPTRP